MRFWFSGPRILGGLVRPGVSISLQELRKAMRPTPAGKAAGSAKMGILLVALLVVWTVVFFQAISGFLSP